MAVEVKLITNCDDSVVFWRIQKRIPDCWGFAIHRERKLQDGTIQRTALDNRMGFEEDHPKPGEHRPSTIWPFQRFWWTDHSVNPGDSIRYRVCPVVRVDGALHELMNECSEWTDWTGLSSGNKDGYSFYFNRGLVISQFMSRYLEDLRVKQGLATRKDALKAFKESLDDHELPIRLFLAGQLRVKMLDLLSEAKKGDQNIFAALYELEDNELVNALSALGARAHVVLSNGSIQAKKGEHAAEARKRDENASARAALREAGVEVFDRFISPGALGHNKFLVLADKDSKPLAAWTGSTNWTGTGLCTQINNGLFVDNGEVASDYLEQWERLRDAESAFPKTLVDENSKPKTVKKGGSDAEIWFTRTHEKVDLDALDRILQGAKEGILFLMFQPGSSATLGTVRSLQEERKSLYIKGVVSTLPAEGDESKVSVSIHGASKGLSLDLDVVQPEGISSPFATWAANVTRDEFITMKGGVIGFAIVHSKIIVVDPFTNPVVVTGSHNFSLSASEHNDENFVIVRGNVELARHYAAHILSVYHHYRWLAFVNELQGMGKSPNGYLMANDSWQDSQLTGPTKRELDFWLGNESSTAGISSTPTN
jgi:phosphatidylserine/phosphatidylglycerophosphate/cardiolipin synthase-like enzyme